MAQQNVPYRKRLAALFVSFSILIIGTLSITRTMSLDYYTVLNTLTKLIPSCIIMGLLGWVMGMILDQPKRRHRIGYGNLLVNDLMKNSVSKILKTEDEETIKESL